MWSPLLPLLAALAASLVGAVLARRVRPNLAAVTTTATAVLLALTAVGTVALYAAGFLVPLHHAESCPWWLGTDLPVHRRVGVMLAAVVCWRGAVALRSWWGYRRVVRSGPDSREPLVVVDGDAPVAFARPVGSGQIVVSAGLLRNLGHDERLCLLAHERAHLDGRHHQLLLLTDVSAAWFPALAAMRGWVRRATERAADEMTARRVGDRALVARTIARAAVATHERLPAAGGSDVVGRCEALLAPAPPRRPATVAGLLGTVAACGLAALLVLHHLVDVLVAAL